MAATDDDLHYVTEVDALGDGERAIVGVKGREVAVFSIDGELHAVGSHCPHMGGPCAEGLLSGTFGADEDGRMTYERDGQILSCPWHGWEFDVLSGEHLGHSKRRLMKYDVVTEDGKIYLDV